MLYRILYEIILTLIFVLIILWIFYKRWPKLGNYITQRLVTDTSQFNTGDLLLTDLGGLRIPGHLAIIIEGSYGQKFVWEQLTNNSHLRRLQPLWLYLYSKISRGKRVFVRHLCGASLCPQQLTKIFQLHCRSSYRFTTSLEFISVLIHYCLQMPSFPQLKSIIGSSMCSELIFRVLVSANILDQNHPFHFTIPLLDTVNDPLQYYIRSPYYYQSPYKIQLL